MAGTVDIVFYDGDCGLCHRAVRFALEHDESGSCFCFAPLFGETFAATVHAETRDRLPDSIVLITPDRRLLVKWRAVDRMLSRLGGKWRLLARVARLIPVPLLDLMYDGIAAVRRMLFARPASACPAHTPEQRGRFLA